MLLFISGGGVSITLVTKMVKAIPLEWQLQCHAQFLDDPKVSWHFNGQLYVFV